MQTTLLYFCGVSMQRVSVNRVCVLASLMDNFECSPFEKGCVLRFGEATVFVLTGTSRNVHSTVMVDSKAC